MSAYNGRVIFVRKEDREIKIVSITLVDFFLLVVE